jgi:hypothetical protein
VLRKQQIGIANQTLQRTPGSPSVLARAGGGAADLNVIFFSANQTGCECEEDGASLFLRNAELCERNSAGFYDSGDAAPEAEKPGRMRLDYLRMLQEF